VKRQCLWRPKHQLEQRVNVFHLTSAVRCSVLLTEAQQCACFQGNMCSFQKLFEFETRLWHMFFLWFVSSASSDHITFLYSVFYFLIRVVMMFTCHAGRQLLADRASPPPTPDNSVSPLTPLADEIQPHILYIK
jgi:hypothetical protein